MIAPNPQTSIARHGARPCQANKENEHMKNNPGETARDGFVVSSPRILFTNPVVDLVVSKVRCLRTSIEKDFYKFHFPAWVNIVALTEKRELILIRQYRFGTDRIELEVPGGAVNEGEDPLAAGLRELLEETGYSGENGRIIGKVCPNPAIQNNFCYTVLVEDVRKVAEPDQDDMEDIEVLTVPQDDVQTLVDDGAIGHGLVLNALMFFVLEKRRSRLQPA
jgi:8-oxo-dGTP pyrophosphatase MutT (NUDIX family)